jgi:hypothetical protein
VSDDPLMQPDQPVEITQKSCILGNAPHSPIRVMTARDPFSGEVLYETRCTTCGAQLG